MTSGAAISLPAPRFRKPRSTSGGRPVVGDFVQLPWVSLSSSRHMLRTTVSSAADSSADSPHSRCGAAAHLRARYVVGTEPGHRAHPLADLRPVDAVDTCAVSVADGAACRSLA